MQNSKSEHQQATSSERKQWSAPEVKIIPVQQTEAGLSPSIFEGQLKHIGS